MKGSGKSRREHGGVVYRQSLIAENQHHCVAGENLMCIGRLMWKTGRGRMGGGWGGVLIQQSLPVIHTQEEERQTRSTAGSPTVAGEGAQGRGTLPRSFASVFSVFTENEELGRSESKRGVMESCRTA